MDNSERADGKDGATLVELLRPYHCHNCGAYIGEINSSDELVMETAVLQKGSFHCSNCGMTKDWYECDQKLERIIDKIVQRRLTKYVTMEYNTHNN